MQANFRHLDQALGPRIDYQGSSYLYFGGTAYLGIPQHKGMNMLVQEGFSKYGLNNGTSRSNNVQLGIYDQAENFAAQLFQAQSALICSSGYLAAHLGVKLIASEGNLEAKNEGFNAVQIRYSPQVHPSLWLNGSPSLEQVCSGSQNLESQYIEPLSFERWAKNIIEEINSSKQNTWVVVSNSINNLMPERFDFGVFKHIHKDKRVFFLVDDSHGIGVLNGGLGILPELPQVDQIEWIVVASMAKALGVDAGIILGTSAMIQRYKAHEIYLGASPPSAAALFAFMKSKEFYALEWLKLQKNCQLLESSGILNENWQWAHELPVYLYKPGGLSQELIDRKVLISAFAYPDKNGKLLERLVLSSWHSPDDIQDLVVSLNSSLGH